MNRTVYHLLKSSRQAINNNVNSEGRNKVKLRASKSGDKVYKIQGAHGNGNYRVSAKLGSKQFIKLLTVAQT